MELIKSKTFWSAIGALIVAIGGYFSGDVTQAAALPTAVIGVLGIFIRSAIAKLGSRVDEAAAAVEIATAKTAAVAADAPARERVTLPSAGDL